MSEPLFVIGAGADRCLGFPLMNDLMFELRKFKDGDGRPIHDALRSHVKGLQFDFDKYAGEKGSTMGTALLGGDGSTLAKVKALVYDTSVTVNPQVEALRIVVDRLENIRVNNDLSDDDRRVFAAAEGTTEEITADHLIDPNNVRFSDVPRKVLRDALKQAIQESGTGRSELYTLLLSLSNFEELLGDFFTGFFTKDATLQKRYFYLAWLFWAYIRICEFQNPSYEGSFYELLNEIGKFDLITFNYTKYAAQASGGRAKYFHGNNDVILDFATRELDRSSTSITDLIGIKRLIENLECIFGSTPAVKVPGLVPPLIMKPILASEYLDWWYESAKLIEQAEVIVIVGYSFAFADEHFNDLIRKRARTAKIVVFDPFWDSVCSNLCRVTGVPDQFEELNEHGLPCRKGGRLSFYQASGDTINIAQLSAIISEKQ
jgi:hypothetical protein